VYSFLPFCLEDDKDKRGKEKGEKKGRGRSMVD
jgi:hypothetical protein